MSFFDVVDEHDNPTGTIASYDEVHRAGLWHRGVHIIIYTPDKQIVMQKRSPSLAYHPDEIEISVGGGVNAGERPERAILREVQEELGLTLDETQLQFLQKAKVNHTSKKRTSRFFQYSYAICVPKERLRLVINPRETTQAFLISEKELRKALRVHRIKNMGRISSLYAYWTFLLDSIS